ncbi:NAD-specific glutamate dehydrogenase [Arachis hypogaea]|nr:NAD-specific glutamate dehydrogenase [Arachis hypogaea]
MHRKPPSILCFVLLCLLHHSFNLLFAQPSFVVSDGDLVLRRLVLRRHVQDAIGIDVEAHVDLRHPSRRWQNPLELKCSQKVVVLGPCPLTLVHLNQHAGLVVRVGREHLLFLGRYGGIPENQDRHHPTDGFNAQAEGRDVEKKQVLDFLVAFAAQDGSLNSSLVSHGLVGVMFLQSSLPLKKSCRSC